jgi:tryptophan synthase alpha chain
MGRIAGVFHERGTTALIGFTVAGDPDKDTCVRIARTLIDAGTDILELGVPFSDPVADGPTIQRADDRALAAGTTPDTVFAIVRELRQQSDVPIVLLAYFNTVFRRGIGPFYRDAHAAGVDGILIADMPLEESGEVIKAAKKNAIDQILLVARTTSDGRLEKIAKKAQGFLYLVSVLGVTGARSSVPEGAFDLVRRVKAVTDLPVALGFGISTPDQVASCAAHGADGVIVGSAIVDLVEQNLKDHDMMLHRLEQYIASLHAALREPSVER